MGRRQAGFTLIELLIVTTIIGILSGIMAANLMQAQQKARQRRTMADMRAIALAIDAYITDLSFAPAKGTGTATRLVSSLVPSYLRTMPTRDGWSEPILYSANGYLYTLHSFGADASMQNPIPGGPTSRFGDDIVYSNGSFVQWPEGPQRY